MKILVLGLGQLGMFFAQHFTESLFEVFGWDTNPDKQAPFEHLGGHWSKTANVDAVVLCIFPRDVTKILLEELDPNALLVNVSSVQQPGIEALVRCDVDENRIFSFHPLFGPVGINQSGWIGKQIIVTVDNEKDARTASLLQSFIQREVAIDKMSPEEHDQKMIPHALAFFVADLIKAGAERVDSRYLTSSGRHLLGLLDFTDASPQLHDLILSNPALKNVFPKLAHVLTERATQYNWEK